LVPTVAGILLFGHDENVLRLLPRTSVIATRFSGDNNQAPVIERIELHGNLASLYEKALRFVSRYCDLWNARADLKRSTPDTETPITPRANYQCATIQEGIANALVHRDLALRDISTRIHIFDRAIEIVNPRRSAGFAPAALRAIRFGVPQRLNPQIAGIFSNPTYGLTLAAGGLPMLLREARSISNRLPDIAAFNDEFRLRIHGI